MALNLKKIPWWGWAIGIGAILAIGYVVLNGSSSGTAISAGPAEGTVATDTGAAGSGDTTATDTTGADTIAAINQAFSDQNAQNATFYSQLLSAIGSIPQSVATVSPTPTDNTPPDTGPSPTPSAPGGIAPAGTSASSLNITRIRSLQAAQQTMAGHLATIKTANPKNYATLSNYKTDLATYNKQAAELSQLLSGG